MGIIWDFFNVSSKTELSFRINFQGFYAFVVVPVWITGKTGLTHPSLEEKPKTGRLPAKRVCQKVRGSGLKGVADILPVKVKALADFIQVITAEFFKQCICNDRGQNSLGYYTGSGYCAGVAPLKS
jgi:hypothetical protein